MTSGAGCEWFGSEGKGTYLLVWVRESLREAVGYQKAEQKQRFLVQIRISNNRSKLKSR